jgi:hypothetical protein
MYNTTEKAVAAREEMCEEREKLYEQLKAEFEEKMTKDFKTRIDEIRKFILLLLNQNSENLVMNCDYTSFTLKYEKHYNQVTQQTNPNYKTPSSHWVDRFHIRVDMDSMRFETYSDTQNGENYTDDRFFINKDFYLELKDLVYDIYIKKKQSNLDNFLKNSYVISGLNRVKSIDDVMKIIEEDEQ